MKTKTREINVQIKWNAKHEAVEIVSISDSHDRDLYVDFLTIEQEIKDLLLLEYTEDGCVLSAKGYAKGGTEWKEMAYKNLNAKPGLSIPFVRIPLPELTPTKAVLIDKGGWAVKDNTTVYKGFKTRLQAERFLKRLWHRSAGVYFLDEADDQKLDGLLTFNNIESKLWEVSTSKGYGDMRWVLSSEDGEDSIYFDFSPLPDWTNGYYQVDSALDCNSGGFVEGFEASIVHKAELKEAMASLIQSALSWFSENDLYHAEIESEAEELRETICKAVDRI